RADVGFLLVVAAVMAQQLTAKTVLDQPCRAGGALEPVPADAAKRQRRVTSPVEEEERLLLPPESLAHARDQERGKEAALCRRMPAHVYRGKFGKRRIGKAAGQCNTAIASLVGVHP